MIGIDLGTTNSCVAGEFIKKFLAVLGLEFTELYEMCWLAGEDLFGRMRTFIHSSECTLLTFLSPCNS